MKSTQENGSVTEAASSMGFPLASATLLILFGVVFQVAELACRKSPFWQLVAIVGAGIRHLEYPLSAF